MRLIRFCRTHTAGRRAAALAGALLLLATSLLAAVAPPAGTARAMPYEPAASGPVHAAGSCVYFSSSNISTRQTTSFNISLMVDCGTGAEGAQAVVEYDPKYLDASRVVLDSRWTSGYPTKQSGKVLLFGGVLGCDTNCPKGVVRLATITFYVKSLGSPDPVRTDMKVDGIVTQFAGDCSATSLARVTILEPPTPTPTYTPTASPTPLATATPMGLKFEDRNGNGLADAGEPLLGGWTIRILDPLQQVVYQTTTVDDPGRPDYGRWYLPWPLAAGAYYVEEVPQAGWVQTLPGSFGGRYLIVWNTDNTITVVLGPTPDGAQGLTFGNLQRAPTPTPSSGPGDTPTPSLTPTVAPSDTPTLTPSPSATPTPAFRGFLPLIVK